MSNGVLLERQNKAIIIIIIKTIPSLVFTPVFTAYQEVNAVRILNSAGTGTVKSKFVHLPNSVNTLKIGVGLYF